MTLSHVLLSVLLGIFCCTSRLLFFLNKFSLSEIVHCYHSLNFKKTCIWMIPKPVSLYTWSFLAHISNPLLNFVLVVKNSNITEENTLISGKTEDLLWRNPLTFTRTRPPRSVPSQILHHLQDEAKFLAVALEAPSPTSPSYLLSQTTRAPSMSNGSDPTRLSFMCVLLSSTVAQSSDLSWQPQLCICPFL